MLSRVRFFRFSSKTSKSRILDFNLLNCCGLFFFFCTLRLLPKNRGHLRKGQEALLHLREENQKLIAELSEANVTIEKVTNMMGMAKGSLEQVESYKKTRNEDVAKLRGELLKEKASREGA